MQTCKISLGHAYTLHSLNGYIKGHENTKNGKDHAKTHPKKKRKKNKGIERTLGCVLSNASFRFLARP